jgi:DNA mismatch endonuclease (patch repair protein)
MRHASSRITKTTPARSALMKRVRQRQTDLEELVRDIVCTLGIEPEMNCRYLPGSPDLVVPEARLAIFVHGCFWHFHRRGLCKLSGVPATNAVFWRTKLEQNRQRDVRKARMLRQMGWRVLTLWQCDLQKRERRVRIRLEKELIRQL